MKAAASLVEMAEVSKSFIDGRTAKRVLKDVSFGIEAGEIVAIVGKSGVGKTTLLNILAGIERADAGRVEVRDGAGTARIPLVFQTDSLLPWMSVTGNIGFPLRAGGQARARANAEARHLLWEFDLSEVADAFPMQLSGGMKKRIEIARAFATNSPLVLCDEPFASLDYFTRRSVREWFLKKVAAFNITVVLVTHDLDEAVELSGRVIVLAGEPATIVAEIELDGLDKRDPAQRAGVVESIRASLSNG